MNIYGLIAFSLLITCNLKDPEMPSVDKELPEMPSKKTYDSVQAAAWGADQYGMKQYVLVFLKAGPNRSQDSVIRANG